MYVLYVGAPHFQSSVTSYVSVPPPPLLPHNCLLYWLVPPTYKIVTAPLVVRVRVCVCVWLYGGVSKSYMLRSKPSVPPPQ